MSNKRWAQEGDKHVLYFAAFHDVEIAIAEVEHDDYGWWISIKGQPPRRLMYRDKYDKLPLAQKEAEEMIADHYTDQRDYYAALLTAFEEADDDG